MKQEYIVEELRNPEAQQNINCRISTYFFRMITLEPCLFRLLIAHDSLKRLILSFKGAHMCARGFVRCDCESPERGAMK